MITFRWIKDILTGKEETWIEPIRRAGLRLPPYLPREFRQQKLGIIEVNGERLNGKQATEYTPRSGDVISIAVAPAGISPIIFGIGIAIGEVGLAATTFITSNALLLGTLGGLFLLQAVLNKPPKSPTLKPNEPDDESHSRSFSGIRNTIGPGRVIPICYGHLRVGGQITELFTNYKFETNGESDGEVTDVTEVKKVLSAAPTINASIDFCWGPIERIANIEIDGNPIENIKGIKYEVQLGTNIQKSLAGFTESKTYRSFGDAVTYAGGAVVKQTNVDVNTVEIKIYFDTGLYEYDDVNLAVIERSVDVRFSYKKSSDPTYTTFDTVTFTARSRVPLEFWVRYPNLEPDTYDIKVERITADTADSDIYDTLEWAGMNEVQFGKRAFPRVARMGIRQIAQERTAVPRTYTAELWGTNNIRVYSDASTYTEQWTDNPAWVCADWITSRHAAGKFYDYDDIEIADFLLWARHCDEIVSDGRGGTERRCTFDFYLDETIDFYEFVQLVGEAGDAKVIEVGGKWKALVDKERPMAKVLNEVSYKMDSLKYGFVAARERANRLTIDHQNAERNYEADTFIQEDPEATDATVFRTAPLTLWGVTRPSHVARYAIRNLNRNRLQDVDVQFTGLLATLPLKAGDVFGLNTATGSIGVENGLIRGISADKKTLELDSDVTLDPVNTYEIYVQHITDGVYSSKLLTGVIADTTNFVTVTDDRWPRDIQAGDRYALGKLDLALEKYEIIRASLSPDLTKQITAVRYYDAIYDVTITSNPPSASGEGDIPVHDKVFREWRIAPDVSNVRIVQRAGTPRTIDISWEPPDTLENETIRGYQIFERRTGSVHWVLMGFTQGTEFWISQEKPWQMDLLVGNTYDVIVIAVTQGAMKRSLDDATVTQITLT